MYADDTHLTYADKDVNINHSCLNQVFEWRLAKHQEMADR